MEYYIFGAKAIAFSVYTAIRYLYKETKIRGFLVSSIDGNPDLLAGLPVREIEAEAKSISGNEKKEMLVLVATPEDVHKDIVEILIKNGFNKYKLMDAKTEQGMMERYYRSLGIFPALHGLPEGEEAARMSVYAAQFHMDKTLIHPPEFPDYVHSLLLGSEGNRGGNLKKKTEFYDNTGDNISIKNPNYCELTAFYWIWKNQLHRADEYVGVYHYRRCLDISESDCRRLRENNVDAVLQFPMMHAPDIREHHTRYVKEQDWETMLAALREIHPE